MGIRTDPGYRLYTGDNLCFPSGKTPTKLYATISGLKNASWMPPHLFPIFNGTFLLEKSGSRSWTWLKNQYVVTLVLYDDSTWFVAGVPGVGEEFYFNPKIPCQFSGANEYQTEARGTYGGSFIVSSRD